MLNHGSKTGCYRQLMKISVYNIGCRASKPLENEQGQQGLATSDTYMVARARDGDLEAFDNLVSMHQDRVFTLAYRILGNAEDAADVQQETFVKAWQSLKKFRQDSTFSTWLHRITVNLCLSWKRKTKPMQLDIRIEENLVDREESGITSLEKAETAAIVRKVLNAMPMQHKTLIVLREIEERPFEEIAEILGCSINSVRSRLSKAKKLLRERLKPYLSEEEI